MNFLRFSGALIIFVVGIAALYLPFFTFVMSLASFGTWDQASFIEKAYGVYVLFAFTGFSAMPSLICLTAAALLLKRK